ncbi:MAG: hypothetical protein IPL73_24900 [Candidatus Obscuribacter sp.]|nr:hypothetical protein [Candidatus Obscuribacter sp.]
MVNTPIKETIETTTAATNASMSRMLMMFVLICYEPLQLDGQRLLVDLNS